MNPSQFFKNLLGNIKPPTAEQTLKRQQQAVRYELARKKQEQNKQQHRNRFGWRTSKATTRFKESDYYYRKNYIFKQPKTQKVIAEFQLNCPVAQAIGIPHYWIGFSKLWIMNSQPYDNQPHVSFKTFDEENVIFTTSKSCIKTACGLHHQLIDKKGQVLKCTQCLLKVSRLLREIFQLQGKKQIDLQSEEVLCKCYKDQQEHDAKIQKWKLSRLQAREC